MKKTTGIIVKIFLGIILLILVLLLTVPLIFKEKIRTRIEKEINGSINATVKFDDYKLGFFHNFPYLTFSLNDVSVVGTDKFENDTLAGFRSFDLVFNLSSLFGKSGYEVKTIVINRAMVNAIVLKDGTANWNILKDTTETVSTDKTSSSEMKILLKKVTLKNSSLSYVDDESAIKAYVKDLNFILKGDLTMSETDMQMALNAGEFTFLMDGMKYINKAVVDSKIDLLANLDKMEFTFRDNYFSVNDLKINFSGMVAMPCDDIETDLQFGTASTSLKALLSIIPAVYINDYKDLKTSGEFTLTGTAKGIYSEADSTLPDVSLALIVSNGLMSYPSLPEQIKNINIKSNVFIDGKDMDKTIVGVDLFHIELAGSPFDMTFTLKTPVSDPDFNGSMVGRIDLSALSKAIPMDSLSLSGIIDMSVRMAGRMSMIEKKQYDSFKASGTMDIKNMLVAKTGYPEVKINSAGFEFSPAYATISNTSMTVGGKSDFAINGRIENYVPYIFSDQTIKGNLVLHSRLTDISEIMSKMETTDVDDTTSLAVINIPENIDFDTEVLIEELRFNNIEAQKVKGHIIVRNGILSIRETEMNILNGTMSMNADYDTRDAHNPVMKADFDILNIAVKDAFNTFNTVQKLAPASKGIEGKINAQLAFRSLLGKDMKPIINSINGEGKLQSDEITLVESSTFNLIKTTLMLGDKYSNTFKDINISFKIADGKIFVSPFDVKTGNMKMNISGEQGIDQSLNYLVKTEMPRTDLGGSINSFIDNLSKQASVFGITLKPSDVLKVNIKVTGTLSKPVVTPVF